MQTLEVFYQPVPAYIPWEVLTKKEDMEPFKLGGFGASPGIVEGPCTVIRNPEDLQALRDGAILVCEAPSPALAPHMRFLRGLVAARGGSHCIAAGYAREHGIPAVVGVWGAMQAVHNGDVIRIDGSSGTVDIIG